LQRSGEDDDREPGAAAALAMELGRLRAAHEQLRARIQELETELEARTRRLHQLIGERDQLAMLMRGRDETVQQLNRELGARQAAPRQSGSGGLLSRLQRTFGRLPRVPRRGLRPASAAGAGPVAAAAVGDPPLVPWVAAGPPLPILCAVVAGLPSARIEAVLELVERQCRERRMTPLLLTSDDASEAFRGRRLVVEVLPTLASLRSTVPDRPAELYLQRRLALIRRKWQPVRIVAFGPAAAELVRLWQDSPFEDQPVPAVAPPGGSASPA